MRQRMKNCEVWRQSSTVDAYNEKINTREKVGEIEMFIYTSSGSTQVMNDVMSVQSTHIGLTNNNFTLLLGDIVKQDGNSYRIDYITETKRMRVLNLELDTNEFC